MTRHFITTRSCAGILALALAVASLPGCAPTEAIQPVTRQNQQNIAALTHNVQALTLLAAPFIEESGKNLMIQRITTVLKEMVQVVGAPNNPAPTQPWQALFQQASPKYPAAKFNERYEYARSAVSRGLAERDTTRLRNTEGWVYVAAANADVTPAKIHALVTEVRKLDQEDLNAYYSNALPLLLPYDPVLAYYSDAIAGVQELFTNLRNETTTQLQLAAQHSAMLNKFADTSVDASQMAQNINYEELFKILSPLGEKYIKNPTNRQAAIDLFSGGFGFFKR